jgi:hypothetical protein
LSFCTEQTVDYDRRTLLSKLVARIAAVFGAYKGNDFPKIIGIGDDGTERHHRAYDVLVTFPGVALFL